MRDWPGIFSFSSHGQLHFFGAICEWSKNASQNVFKNPSKNLMEVDCPRVLTLF